VLHELNAFIDRVEAATGKKVVLYVLRDFEAEYGVLTALDRPLWVPSLLHRPEATWRVWQVEADARVAGIEGASISTS
jgi:lysozyme